MKMASKIRGRHIIGSLENASMDTGHIIIPSMMDLNFAREVWCIGALLPPIISPM